jgi:hypothetical protein
MHRLTAAAFAAALLASPVLAQTTSHDTSSSSSHSQTQTTQTEQTTTWIKVENRLGHRVVVFALFLSASNDPHWGADRLGDAILRPGSTAHITLQGDCRRQDVRIHVLHEDSPNHGPTGEIVRRGLDVCNGLRISPDLPWRVEIPT